MRITSSRIVLVAACAIGFLTASVTEFGVFVAPAQAVNTSISGWDVVSPPVAAGDTAVVITLDASHSLQLTDFDPISGGVIWQKPYSASGVTPGEWLSPAVADGTVLDLAPAGKPANPIVNVSGVDAETGAVKWSLQSGVLLSDNPVACVGNLDFCLTGFNPDGSSDMVILGAATGQLVNLVHGPSRAMGVNLYQSDATTPTFEQLTATGAISWTKPASSIFGPGYDPGQGWNISPVGTLDIGSIGPTVSGNSMNLADNKTAGFSVATGATVWSIPGSYMCMGPLMFLTTQVACQYTGVLHKPKKSGLFPSMKGVTLKLVGFNPTSGAIDWTQPVGDVKQMSSGNGLSFLDATELSVTLPNGKPVLLNTSTGAVTPLKAHTVLWCQKLPGYKIAAIKGAEGGGMRQSAPLYFPCTPDGHPTSKLPASFPSTVGTIVGETFVWPSLDGLQTHTVSGSHASA